MLTLAIDTATKVCSVALCRDGEITAEYNINMGMTHSEGLLPQLEQLLKRTNTKKQDIDTISGRKSAETGDKAGVTRTNKWIRLGNFDLLDTPGTMPPSFENQTYAKHLAYIGAINDDILDMEGLTLELIKDLKEIAPESFKLKYKLDTLDKEALQIFDDVCKKRGFIMRGGESDYTRCARAIIDDLRKLRIDKICFEVEP